MSRFARTLGLTLTGVEGHVVSVEASGTPGLPTTVVSGSADRACRQGPDRVRPALSHLGLQVAPQRWTFNLSPAGLPKNGSGLDLALAVALLTAEGHVPAGAVDGVAHLGEVALDAGLRPVPGTLPMVLAAREAGVTEVVLPVGSAREAALVPGMTVHPVRTLGDVRALHLARAAGQEIDLELPPAAEAAGPVVKDLGDVLGQRFARHALEVAAAGGHNLLLVGPPGAGKTMLAERLPGLLPPLDDQQALEVTAIHSVLGALDSEDALVRRAPFVAPHHNASVASVVGGGTGQVRPGAVSRAHRGVLFLDEAPEFRRDVLEALRQPLEGGEVVVSRAERHVRLPARFQLVLAANPCPCGGVQQGKVGCSCPPLRRATYLDRLSGPLLDRMDLRVTVQRMTSAMLTQEPGESTAVVAERVALARERQRRRWAGSPWQVNAQVPGSVLRQGDHAVPAPARRRLERAMDDGHLTMRGVDRCLRLSWTLADLEGRPTPGLEHAVQALHLRQPEGVKAA